MDLARELIARFGSLRGLLRADQKQFCTAKGLGQAKYVQLQAMLEIACRHLAEALAEPALKDPAQARTFLRHNAAALILAHNHPSGVAEPSEADRSLTRRLREAQSLVDIRVLDHFVIGEGEPLSFAERGWF